MSDGKNTLYLSSVLFAILTWCLLVLRFGYTFGVGDQVELLPYALRLADSNLYPHDFFINSLMEFMPNERFLMALGLSHVTHLLEPLMFVLHFASTLLLVLGMENICRRFIGSRYLAWGCILITLIPFYDWSLGGVELYYNTFQASNLAKAIALWAIILFMDKRYVWSFILLSLVTLLQIITGLTLAITLSLMFIYYIIFTKRYIINKAIISWLIYASTALVFMLLVLMARTTLPTDISDAKFFDIVFRFRHPHHFLFSAFSLVNTVFFGLLMLASLGWFYIHNKSFFVFMLISFLLLIAYIIGVDVLENTWIASFQWYKMTIWMKFFGLVAVFDWIDRQFSQWFKFELPDVVEKVGLVSGILIAVSLFLFTPNYLPYTVPYHFGNQEQEDPLLEIQSFIAEVTPVDAVFIQPFDDSSFKFYSKRSSYIEFKANPRSKSHAAEWYQRVQEVYGISMEMRESGFNLREEAENFYLSHDSVSLAGLKQKGVTHILTSAGHIIDGAEIILNNRFFVVYQLSENTEPGND